MAEINTDRIQLQLLHAADLTLEAAEGAVTVALLGLARAYNVPEPVASAAVSAAIAEFHRVHRAALAPVVTAPGLVSDLPKI